jgi:hypothetical protein
MFPGGDERQRKKRTPNINASNNKLHRDDLPHVRQDPRDGLRLLQASSPSISNGPAPYLPIPRTEQKPNHLSPHLLHLQLLHPPLHCPIHPPPIQNKD